MYPFEPGIYAHAYPSSVVSKYYAWFCEMGYPELDIRQFEDGEWAILQYLEPPLFPSRYKWEWAFTGFRNMEITYDILSKYVRSIDITKKAFWDREDAKSKEVDLEFERDIRHQEDMVTRACTAIRNNPALIERMMKNGLSELDIRNIRRHVPNHRL